MTEPGYLRRLERRREAHLLERRTAFGLALGWLLLLTCGFRALFVVTEHVSLFGAGALVGAGLLVTATVAPALLGPFEAAWGRVAGALGRIVLLTILVVVFVLAICPAGWVLRRRHGTAPFHEWDAAPPRILEGWVPKGTIDGWVPKGTIDGGGGDDRQRPLIVLPLLVLGAFVRNGRYLLLPALVVILLAGIVLFFVQTSALAPFLYTFF